MTTVLLFGVKNSARFNVFITILNLSIIMFIIWCLPRPFLSSDTAWIRSPSLSHDRHPPPLFLARLSSGRSVGSFNLDPDNWDPFFPYGFEGSLKGAGTVFFSFIGIHLPPVSCCIIRCSSHSAHEFKPSIQPTGFDSVTTLAGEVARPGRDLPIGIAGTLGIASFLYVAVSLIITGKPPRATFSIPPSCLRSFVPLMDAITPFRHGALHADRQGRSSLQCLPGLGHDVGGGNHRRWLRLHPHIDHVCFAPRPAPYLLPDGS